MILLVSLTTATSFASPHLDYDDDEENRAGFLDLDALGLKAEKALEADASGGHAAGPPDDQRPGGGASAATELFTLEHLSEDVVPNILSWLDWESIRSLFLTSRTLNAWVRDHLKIVQDAGGPIISDLGILRTLTHQLTQAAIGVPHTENPHCLTRLLQRYNTLEQLEIGIDGGRWTSEEYYPLRDALSLLSRLKVLKLSIMTNASANGRGLFTMLVPAILKLKGLKVLVVAIPYGHWDESSQTKFFKNVKKLEQLVHLGLNGLHDEGRPRRLKIDSPEMIRELAASIANLKLLRTFRLEVVKSRNNPSYLHPVIEALATLEHLERVELDILNFCRNTEETRSFLVALKGLKQISHLALAMDRATALANFIEGVGSTIGSMKNLKVLKLKLNRSLETSFDLDSLLHFLKKHPLLEEIKITANSVSTKTLIELERTALSLPKLKKLSFTYSIYEAQGPNYSPKIEDRLKKKGIEANLVNRYTIVSFGVF